MLKAYDTLLETSVSADTAAANSDNEAFRYECLFCGEEVFLAAQDSAYKATHFRHRSGNNDKECELYLGQYGMLTPSSANRNKRQDRVEFYYQNLHKAFFMSFRFSDPEITAYENVNACIEVRAFRNQTPFFTKMINHTNFCADVPENYMLEMNADAYYISNTLNNIKREYRLFKGEGPTFFKILGEDSNFTAKYVKSRSLYTNVKYFIAWSGRNTAQIYLNKLPGVQIDDLMQFKTMNNCNVWALVATFTEKNQKLDALLQSWGYDLSISEELMLLWPPSYLNNETHCVTTNNIFVFSSFSIQAFGNTNIVENEIHIVDENVTKIDINDKVRILKKNAEMTVELTEFTDETISHVKQYLTTTRFVVPKEGVFFRFSSFGVEKLYPGQIIFLTNNSSVVEYRGNYISKVITLPKDKEISLNERIQRALSYYWVSVPDIENIEGINSMDTMKYQQRGQNGSINKAVLSIIKEENQS